MMTATADCGMGVMCDEMYLGGFSPTTVSGLIELLLTRDIDLDGQMTCESGDGVNTNQGEPCTMDSDCPVPLVNAPPACDQNDAHSVGLKFTGINALITAFERPCDKATCSVY